MRGVARSGCTPHPSIRSGAATGRVRNRLALDGFAVVQDYEQERDGGIHFRGHGVFRWDPEERSYTLHWFDSLGLPPANFAAASRATSSRSSTRARRA